MNNFVDEIIRLWWVEVGTELKNPTSEASIKGLKKVLREDLEFDNDTIKYIVESIANRPSNFSLKVGKSSGIDVGKNQTAVSAQLHPDWEDEDDDSDIYQTLDLAEEDGDEEGDGEEDKDELIAQDIESNALTAYEKDKLKELKILKNITQKLKRVWTEVKGYVSTLFKKALDKLMPGQKTIIKIPALKTENRIEYMNLKSLLSEGAVEAIKGNYNEALTCQYLYNNDGSAGVEITAEYKPVKSEIDGIVKKWDNDLKNAVTNYKEVRSIIDRGSKDMTKYLIGTTIQQDSLIIGAYLDNLSFQGGVEFKADIMVAVMKEGKKVLDAYSLKLYSTKSVNLFNSSPKGMALILAGDKASSEVEAAIAGDSRLQKFIDNAKTADKLYQQAKKDKDEKSKKKYFEERKAARKPINPRLAEITFKILKPYVKTASFSENLLKALGFTDKDTKMLMAVTTDRNSVIIDRHPDLDVSNIDMVLKGTTINIVGPTAKNIVTFGFKEGEKKKLAAKVSFAGIEPVDLASLPIVDEI